jgi:hypothetical protein
MRPYPTTPAKFRPLTLPAYLAYLAYLARLATADLTTKKSKSSVIAPARHSHWLASGLLAKVQPPVPDMGSTLCSASGVTAPLVVAASPSSSMGALLCTLLCPQPLAFL